MSQLNFVISAPVNSSVQMAFFNYSLLCNLLTLISFIYIRIISVLKNYVIWGFIGWLGSIYMDNVWPLRHRVDSGLVCWPMGRAHLIQQAEPSLVISNLGRRICLLKAQQPKGQNRANSPVLLPLPHSNSFDCGCQRPRHG